MHSEWEITDKFGTKPDCDGQPAVVYYMQAEKRLINVRFLNNDTFDFSQKYIKFSQVSYTRAVCHGVLDFSNGKNLERWENFFLATKKKESKKSMNLEKKYLKQQIANKYSRYISRYAELFLFD